MTPNKTVELNRGINTIRPKLVLKKSELPPRHLKQKKSGSCLGRFIAFLLLFAAVAGGVYFYRDRIDWERIPIPGLVDMMKSLDSPVPDSPPVTTASPQPDAPSATPAQTRSTASEPPKVDFAQNEDFRNGARLFNEALAEYKIFQETREQPEKLRELEEKLREALSYFEACKTVAPPHIDIDGYIRQCFGLIENIRQSSGLGYSGTDENTNTTTDAPPSTAPRIEITYLDEPPKPSVRYVDDEPPPEVAPNVANETPAQTNQLRRLSFDPAWNQQVQDAGGIATQLRAILKPRVASSQALELDPSITLFPGITAMMSAREAARRVGQSLGVKRPVSAPGFPVNSLFAYTFEGNFSGARRLTLVVDLNDRVVMTQLYDDKTAPAQLSKSLYSPNWSVVDFLEPRVRNSGDPLVAHQARARGSLVMIDSEMASSPGVETNVSVRIKTIMPANLAGLIVGMNSSP